MRRAVLRPLGAVVTVVVASAVGALSVGPAHGSTGEAPVRLTTFSRIVADEAQGRLFLTTGRDGQDDLLVLGLDGSLDRVLPVAGAEAVVVAGDAVYVSQPRLGAIAVLDAETLERRNTLTLATGMCPGDLATTAGKLVFGYADCATGRGTGGIGVADLTGPASPVTTSAGPTYDPVLATSPGAPGIVVAGDAGLSPTSLSVVDVSGDVPVLVTKRVGGGSNLRDLALAPDGQRVVSAQGSPYQHQVRSVPTLEDESSLESGAYPNAVAWSGDGRTVVTGSDGARPAVRVHDVVEGGQREWLTLASDRYLQDRGLAVSRDGRTVWAVTGDVYGRNLSILVTADDTAPTELWVGTPWQPVYAGEPVTVHGSLWFRDWADTEGLAVEIERTVVSGGTTTTTRLADADASLGDFWFTDTPPAGQVWWTVTYPGDAMHPAATASTEPVSVQRQSASLTLRAPAEATVGTSLHLSGTLAAGSTILAGEVVTVTRSTDGGPAVTVGTATTTLNGAYSVTDVPTSAGSTVYTATYSPTGAAPVMATATTVVAPAPAAVMTLLAPETSQVGAAVELIGTLRLGGSAVVGERVVVTRDAVGAARVVLGAATTNEDGAFQLTDVPVGAGTVTYTATYAPDGGPGVSASATTVVERVTTTLAVTAETGVGKDRRSATVTATLVPSTPTAVVRIVATPERGRAETIASGAVGADGTLAVAYELPKGTTTFSATFGGDATYAPSSGEVSLRR